MNTVSKIALWVIAIAVFNGVMNALGAKLVREVSAFMFDPYIEYFDFYIRDNLPALSSPVVMIIIGALMVLLAMRFVDLSRFVCMIIVALVIYKLAAWVLGIGLALSWGWIIAGIVAALWLLVSGVAPQFSQLREAFWKRFS